MLTLILKENVVGLFPDAAVGSLAKSDCKNELNSWTTFPLRTYLLLCCIIWIRSWLRTSLFLSQKPSTLYNTWRKFLLGFIKILHLLHSVWWGTLPLLAGSADAVRLSYLVRTAVVGRLLRTVRGFEHRYHPKGTLSLIRKCIAAKDKYLVDFFLLSSHRQSCCWSNRSPTTEFPHGRTPLVLLSVLIQ